MPCQSKSVWSLLRGLLRTQSMLFDIRCCNCVFALHFFPSFSISRRFDPCIIFKISLPLVASVSSGLKVDVVFPSLSGHPTDLHVLCLMLRRGFHSAAFFAHRSSGGDAIFIATIEISFFCVSKSNMGF